MNVRLTHQQAAMVERLVAGGQYLTASEVVREGLRLLEQELWRRDARQKLAEGLADVEAGRTVDGETAMAEIRRKLRAKHGPKKA
jgi:antitoxin ParD1/3/4